MPLTLIRLESEGFVTISSKQGIIINDISIERFIDIYDLRVALEMFVCGQICGRLQEEQCKALERNLKETKELVRQSDIQGFTKADHTCYCVNLQGIRKFTAFCSIAKSFAHNHPAASEKRQESNETFLNEHEEIYEKLKQGETAGIDLIREHLQNAKRTLFI